MRMIYRQVTMSHLVDHDASEPGNLLKDLRNRLSRKVSWSVRRQAERITHLPQLFHITRHSQLVLHLAHQPHRIDLGLGSSLPPPRVPLHLVEERCRVLGPCCRRVILSVNRLDFQDHSARLQTRRRAVDVTAALALDTVWSGEGGGERRGACLTCAIVEEQSIGDVLEMVGEGKRVDGEELMGREAENGRRVL